MGHVFDWAEEGIPHFLSEYPEDYSADSWNNRPAPQGRKFRRSVAATLLGVCTRGHVFELLPHPDYARMGIGCSKGRCPGTVYPATLEQVVVFRLLGKDQAQQVFTEEWAIKVGARRGQVR